MAKRYPYRWGFFDDACPAPVKERGSVSELVVSYRIIPLSGEIKTLKSSEAEAVMLLSYPQ